MEGAKDPRERREPPPPPAELDLPLPSRPEEIDAFNQVGLDRLSNSSAFVLGWQIRSVMGCTLQSEGCDVVCRCYGMGALMFVCQSRPHQPTLAASLQLLTHPQIPPSPDCCFTPDPTFPQRMSNIYNGFSLMKCAHCGRSMRPDALTRHQKACTADKPMKSAAGGGAASTSAGPPPSGGGSSAPTGGGRGTPGPASTPSEQPDEEEELEQCAHCGRSMRAEALAKHSRVCTADKPMKSVKKSSAPPPLSSPEPPKPSSSAAASVSPSPPPQPRPSGGGGRRSTNSGETEPSPTRPLPPASSPAASPPSTAGPKGASLGGDRQPVAPANQASSKPPPAEYDPDEAPEEVRAQFLVGEMWMGFPSETLPEYPAVPMPLKGERVQCETCGRRFIPEAFEKHTRICAKVFASKRKAFDSSKARLAGTEAAGAFKAPAGRKPAPAGAASPGPRAGGQQQAGGGGGEPAPKWKSQVRPQLLHHQYCLPLGQSCPISTLGSVMTHDS